MTYTGSILLRGIACTLAIGLAASAVADGQSPKPAIPVVTYPGADFRSLACTPGPPVAENKTYDERIRVFVSDVVSGADVPRYQTTGSQALHIAAHNRLFTQLGDIQSSRFVSANVACVSRYPVTPDTIQMIVYRVHIIGADAAGNFSFVLANGLIDGYSNY